jgi:hypothetical protein
MSQRLPTLHFDRYSSLSSSFCSAILSCLYLTWCPIHRDWLSHYPTVVHSVSHRFIHLLLALHTLGLYHQKGSQFGTIAPCPPGRKSSVNLVPKSLTRGHQGNGNPTAMASSVADAWLLLVLPINPTRKSWRKGIHCPTVAQRVDSFFPLCMVFLFMLLVVKVCTFSIFTVP